jgi:hypothetical protein
LESDLLANAWETTITAAATEPDAERRPSMWVQPVPPPPAAAAVESVAEDAPVDFLFEPLTEAVATEPQAASASRAGGGALAAIEEDLFAGEDEPIVDAASAGLQSVATPFELAPVVAAPVAAAIATPIAAAAAGPAPAVRSAPKQMPRHTANDPLAALKAMTDEERIALFT